jgi:hypothetical protein
MPIVQEAGWAPEEVADVAHILWLQFTVYVIPHDNGVVLIIIIIIIIIITGPSGRAVYGVGLRLFAC